MLSAIKVYDDQGGVVSVLSARSNIHNSHAAAQNQHKLNYAGHPWNVEIKCRCHVLDFNAWVRLQSDSGRLMYNYSDQHTCTGVDAPGNQRQQVSPLGCDRLVKTTSIWQNFWRQFRVVDMSFIKPHKTLTKLALYRTTFGVVCCKRYLYLQSVQHLDND